MSFVSYLNEVTGVTFGESSIAVNCYEAMLDTKNLLHVMRVLKTDPQIRCEQLIDVFGVDYLGREVRFEVVYMLLSIVHNIRVCCKLYCNSETEIPSIVSLYSVAGWFEREVYDMYGLYFANHPDLRRILTDYGFKGHPQLKDFPLTGYEEVRYDLEKKKVTYSPVQLQQEYRSFDFLSPWEGYRKNK